MSISVVILAAGQGTRMKSTTPKVLHEISGKPMLFHAIDAAQKISDDITVVLYHQAARIQEAIEAHYSGIHFHMQDAEQFPGTGGAMKGVKVTHAKVLILNGDMPLVTMSALESLMQGDADINMSVIKLDNPTGYGRVVISQDKVVEIVEEKDCIPAQKDIQTVNAGVYCVKKEVLERYIPELSNDNAQKEYYLTDIIKMAVDEAKIIHPVMVEEEEFKGVNSKLDLAHAEEIMQRRIKTEWMKAGVSMRLPETIYIDSRATFEGECLLENGVSIQGASHIIASHIKTHSVIEDAHIENSDVGPMGRVRPNSKLIGTHIGNFVEVKKSSLTGVKAGHLSYIGDATIDEGTNIGAGVITCNYDGKNKYPTKIGKNVFVGSDTQLVAPVSIDDDVMIAAGSTINKNVAQGELAISRAPLRTVKNFFYKFFGDK
ncbi:bifunctional UDP-N-acetylglucosamine diphosphorylase/glucosamine-1-phosphate N-acetyltransferase GlmU [Sulfurovum sp. XGS-02]|uniref:bifunctional UDP-N-acetylglucosamine diphosphorylase/glucosamine-1-phosphate N-acetyltransferase GlmU n=1 Tax=Sulfurovum sp. XGS-02 TaxID=2925411 RepID=UPI0020585866|nr:bifunctional UDP-N-acetylglucosamine diphosphorylase/glucosamine-1-phosphate N-acetyltransferase GlmU [Sulfurovum sp. XGS-02]UPT77059.1 bifunctional UDP-N-acetylglucosamine diphosphorylase/glucosamine-1-phosphate N-acetyltransferase GlmU [Sulfurovum sp. XGS-02]